MDSEPTEILASGLCTIDPTIKVLPGAEAYDTANIIMRFANGREATIDVCRRAPYGYDQRAEVLGTTAMIQTDNSYPNTARIYSASFTGMPRSQSFFPFAPIRTYTQTDNTVKKPSWINRRFRRPARL